MRKHAALGGHMVDFLFTIALFCAFAATSLIVVIIGANVYQGTVRGMNENYALRTSLSYVSQKVRQNDGAGEIHIGTLDGVPALVLEPTLVAILSVIVGMVLLSVMLPLMGIMSSIG